MARYLNPLVLDNGLAYIAARCDRMIAVIAYTAGDTYATVTAPANVIADAAMTPADFAIVDSGSGRVLNNATKVDVSANNTGNPTHFVFLDTLNSRVLRVSEETSPSIVTAGSSVTMPNVPLVSNQPVTA